jgi:hypothetical protein
MTKKQAKKITLEVWTYLRDHPEIKRKFNLPKELWDKIKSFIGACALCEIMPGECTGCPLNESMFACAGFMEWDRADSTTKSRIHGASEVIRLVKAWKV